ncbi:MAG: cytochrome c oxidase assembly protein [Gemmatimonadota bacterium]
MMSAPGRGLATSSPGAPSRGWSVASLLMTVLAITLLATTPAMAHRDVPLAPAHLWRTWAADPWALLGLGAAAWAYAVGVGRVWARAGDGRGIARWRLYCYAAGILTLFIALVSPLDPLGGTLFSAHMVQHELLIVAAAPLLVLGLPLVAFAWALPRRWRRRVGRVVRLPQFRASWRLLTHPLSAWTLHAAAILIWHAPTLYQSTLESSVAHSVQHLSFFGTALLFWWAILQPNGSRRLSPGLAVIYLFTTAVYGTALGALLTLSPVPWYPLYGDRAMLWGLSQIEDQQLGGLIMWVPFGLLYTAAALVILGRWLHHMNRREVGSPVLTPR